MTYYGVMKDDDYSDSHKRERLTIWSGAFASVYEGEAYSLPKGDGYMLTTAGFFGMGSRKVRIASPTPRTEDTYQQVDAAINAALNALDKEN